MDILPHLECKKFFPGDNFLCSIGKDNIYQGPCFGDSGAPLVSMAQSTEYTLIGTYAIRTLRDCHNGHPAGYINIYKFTSWIYNISNGLM